MLSTFGLADLDLGAKAPKTEKPNSEIAKHGRPQTTPSQQDRTQTPKCPRECAPDVKKKNDFGNNFAFAPQGVALVWLRQNCGEKQEFCLMNAFFWD